MKLVTIATFTYPHEAAILKSRLQSEGIQYFSKDENTLQVQPFYSNGIGGVKIQVLESDIMKANKIVQEYYANTNNASAPEIPEEEYMQVSNKPYSVKGDDIVCPVCGSDDVYRDKTPRRITLIAILLLGIPLLIPPGRKYHCFNCGHNFKPN
jgi:predicted RNA-binding Zn-ribbon protein involved in translation (DUF1610 family)